MVEIGFTARGPVEKRGIRWTFYGFPITSFNAALPLPTTMTRSMPPPSAHDNRESAGTDYDSRRHSASRWLRPGMSISGRLMPMSRLPWPDRISGVESIACQFVFARNSFEIIRLAAVYPSRIRSRTRSLSARL